MKFERSLSVCLARSVFCTHSTDACQLLLSCCSLVFFGQRSVCSTLSLLSDNFGHLLFSVGSVQLRMIFVSNSKASSSACKSCKLLAFTKHFAIVVAINVAMNFGNRCVVVAMDTEIKWICIGCCCTYAACIIDMSRLSLSCASPPLCVLLDVFMLL